MIDLALQTGVSNLCVSIAIAAVAFAVHRTGRWPLIAHLLWVLVLVKLITPPLFTMPVVPLPTTQASPVISLAQDATPVTEAAAVAEPNPERLQHDLSSIGAMHEADQAAATGMNVPTLLTCCWIAGSILVLVWSAVRIARFDRMLRRASETAPDHVRKCAERLAGQLRLRRTPCLCLTRAHISPMVWWVGGRVRIVLPESLVEEISQSQLRWIIAHELAHVKRCDHLVRWLEWLACVAFWWNPIAWWARRNLRINEEICCDALVLRALQPTRRTYANALMSVVEFLAAAAVRPPAVASEISSGGTLERRFAMIVSTQRLIRTPRWLTGGVLAAALGLMPLGIAYGQDFDAVERRLGDAVAHGELTLEQAVAMMDTLRAASLADRAIATDRQAEALAQRKRDAVAAIERARRQWMVDTEPEDRRDDGRLHKRRSGAERGGLSPEDASRLQQEIQRVKERFERQSRRDSDAAAGERDEVDARDRQSAREAAERIAALQAELKAAIAAGKISEEDARRRIARARVKIDDHARRAARDRRETDVRDDRTDKASAALDAARARLSAAEAELRAAVEAGRMDAVSAKQSIAKLKAAVVARHAAMEDARRISDSTHADEAGRVRVRVRDADAKRIHEDELEAVVGRAGESVERRDITSEETNRIAQALRERVAAEKQKAEAFRRAKEAKQRQAEGKAKREADARDARSHVAKVLAELEKRVAEGELSKEEVARRIAELRQRLAEIKERQADQKDKPREKQRSDPERE